MLPNFGDGVLFESNKKFKEDLLEQFDGNESYDCAAEFYIALSEGEVWTFGHLFYEIILELSSGRGMMLKLENLGETKTALGFDFEISLRYELLNYWHQDSVDLWHVEQMDRLFDVD